MKGWRTIAGNLVMGVLGYLQTGGAHQVIPPEYVPVVMMAANWLLRYITTTPVGVG